MKLKKPRQFEASTVTLNVDFAGTTLECANLLKSGIINQSVVLVGYNDVWHEINTADLTIVKQIGPTAKDMQYTTVSSNLTDFKNHVETNKFTLVSIGLIAEEKPNVNYMDFFALAKFSTKNGYLEIEKLFKYLGKDRHPRSKSDLRDWIKYMDRNNLTVNQLIDEFESDKYEIIHGMPAPPKTEIINAETAPNIPIMNKEVLTPERLAQRKITRVNDLNSLGMQFDEFEGNFEGHGFCITTDSIEGDADDEWKSLYVRIRDAAKLTEATFTNTDLGDPFQETSEVLETPEARDVIVNEPEIVSNVPEAPEKTVEESEEERKTARHESISEPKNNLITLEGIGNMKPESISELQGLSEKQDAVVKANPFVKIMDAKTLKQAKTAKANLLKSSTETEKIETNASKYLNTFKAMIKKIVEPAAKKTRDAHKLQADEISTYENAEALRVQAEEKAKLEKISARTKTLFAVPFVFNGSLYQIGTLYITPSQIKDSTDEEFDVLVKQGEAIKTQIDAAAVAESAKDAMIRELQEKLALLMAPNKPEVVVETPASPIDTPSEPAPAPVTETKINTSKTVSSPSTQSAPSTPTVSNTDRVPFKFTPRSDYELPAPGNKILNQFDAEHMEHVQAEPIPIGYIKSREWLKHGTRLLADEILAIMANPDPSVKKAPLIIELCTIIKNDA